MPSKSFNLQFLILKVFGIQSVLGLVTIGEWLQ